MAVLSNFIAPPPTGFDPLSFRQPPSPYCDAGLRSCKAIRAAATKNVSRAKSWLVATLDRAIRWLQGDLDPSSATPSVRPNCLAEWEDCGVAMSESSPPMTRGSGGRAAAENLPQLQGFRVQGL